MTEFGGGENSPQSRNGQGYAKMCKDVQRRKEKFLKSLKSLEFPDIPWISQIACKQRCLTGPNKDVCKGVQSAQAQSVPGELSAKYYLLFILNIEHWSEIGIEKKNVK